MPHIIVSGAIANKPQNGGEAWVRLSWLNGFRQIGCDVHFIEQIDTTGLYDARGQLAAPQHSVQVRHFRQVVEQAAWDQRAYLLDQQGAILVGPSSPTQSLDGLLDRADLLVNISGHLHCESIFSRLRRKAYIDIDPGFTQFWHASGNAGARLAGHDLFFTIGENIGCADCPIPTVGIAWQHVRQPAVLTDWQDEASLPATHNQAQSPRNAGSGRLRFTTIASWRGAFGAVEFGGQRYGLKCHEFRKLLALPRRVPDCDFEIALDIHSADGQDFKSLGDHGWQIVDPRVVASSIEPFRNYVRNSNAEFSVAQGIYGETNSGWFSDRTVRYLAAGKPVLVQDTGFGRHLPVGAGLLAFCTLEQAVAGAEQIRGDYARHCRAASDVARQSFDARIVLPKFLNDCGISN